MEKLKVKDLGWLLYTLLLIPLFLVSEKLSSFFKWLGNINLPKFLQLKQAHTFKLIWEIIFDR